MLVWPIWDSQVTKNQFSEIIYIEEKGKVFPRLIKKSSVVVLKTNLVDIDNIGYYQPMFL
jgi:hypothetical protein